VVAIDGPAGVGKSTVARRVAARLGFALVDTGALYRSVAYLADEAGVDWHDVPALVDIACEHEFSFDLEGRLSVDGAPVGTRIRTPRISEGSSVVAKHPEVRKALLGLQRRLGRDGGIVLEGRDIGSVVFPDAEVKVFLTASARVRAERRFEELRDRGVDTTLEAVEAEQIARDEQDSGRAVSPLVKAEDAVEVCTDDLGISEVVEEVLARAAQISF